VKGNYTFEPNGNIRGDFNVRVKGLRPHAAGLGKLTGSFVFMAGKAEVTITEKPFLLPEAVLRLKLLEALKEFCTKFPT
jgi:hypothetical protein